MNADNYSSVERAVERLAAKALAEIREMGRRARVELGVIDPRQVNQIRKLHEIRPGRYYRLPHPLFECPECGGSLAFELDAWDTWFGMVIGSGLRVTCVEEDAEWMRAFEAEDYPRWEHRHWQSDWQHVITKAERFVAQRCRVVEERQ
ncbi:MAG: hypothetical protein IT529_06240 [Burkholderiales bacterium]|nr:hypothetical protein [Burkholderiales bacterium]